MYKILLTILSLLQFAYGLDKATIGDLKKYTGTATTIIVKGGKAKGTFYPYTGTRKADGGIIVADGRGRLWERQWLLQNGVMPEFWEAQGDAVKDDILALEAARDYINSDPNKPHLQLSYGYRITRQFKSGGAPLSATDALWYQISNTAAPSYSLPELVKVGNTLPFSIYATTRAFIFGDFEPDTLTAIVSIGASGWQYGGFQYQSTIISGLKVVGKHHFDYNYTGTDSKQVGLVMYGGNHISMDNCTFYGVKEGYISNTQYSLKLSQIFFGNCGRGFFSIGSHGTKGELLFADHCDLGYEIVSNQCVFTLNGEQNKRTLITAQENTFIGGYIEQLDNTSGENDYQIQVGYPQGHPFYTWTFYGVKFDGVAVSARNQKHYLIEQGTTSNEDTDNVTITKMTFGYNTFRNEKTRIKSSGISWIYKPLTTGIN